MEFTLLGISSHEDDYHLSWALNQSLGMNFTRTNNLEIPSSKTDMKQEFSVYQYEDENSMLIYNIISNKSGNGVLIPDLKNIDYFLQIYGDINHSKLDNIIEELRNSGVLNASFRLDPNTIKGAEKLLFS